MIQIQLRRGSAALWTATNPLLAEGEMGVETDTGKFKFGDGILDWNTLPYGGSVVSSYTHTQGVASATWVVNHNLGFRPEVALTDAAGSEFAGEVLHVTNNQANIYLTSAITGQARFN